MMKWKLITWMLLLTGAVTAQKNNGFYGKKFFFDLSARGATPIINNVFMDNYYKATGSNNLQLSLDRLNYGFSGTIGMAYERDKAISLNVSQMYGNIPGPGLIIVRPSDANEGTGNFTIYTEHENLSVRSLVIMPNLCFSSKSSLLPVGVSHEFGIGYRITSIVEKDYVYEASPFYYAYTDQTGNYHQINASSNAEANAFVDSLVKADGPYIDYNRKYSGISLSYAMRIRRPLNDYLALNAGLRYSLHFTKSSDKGYYMDPILDEMLSYHRFSIITFDIGLTLLF